MFSHTKSLKFYACCFLSLIATGAQSEDLVSIYQKARANNPTYLEAVETSYAARQAYPLAMGQLLPSLQGIAQGSTTSTNTSQQKYRTEVYSLNLNQPIFNLANILGVKQASIQVKSAYTQLADAEQTLILDIAQGYFQVLGAIDNLNFIKAQRDAFGSSLAQAKQKFKVGLIAITDVLTAQAASDSALAGEIDAQSQLDNAREQLRQMVGRPVRKLAPLKEEIHLTPPRPNKIEAWVSAAYANNLSLQLANYSVQVAHDTMKIQWAGNMPTINVNGTVSKGVTTPSIGRGKSQTIGLSMTLPIFSGGIPLAQVRQATHLYKAAMENRDQTLFNVKSNTRQTYRNVLSKISQVQALKQAVVSNQSALKSIRAAYNVGTSTMTDVLSAQSNFIQAEYNYKIARYAYITQSLSLKQAAGILNLEDLLQINQWLSQA